MPPNFCRQEGGIADGDRCRLDVIMELKSELAVKPFFQKMLRHDQQPVRLRSTGEPLWQAVQEQVRKVACLRQVPLRPQITRHQPRQQRIAQRCYIGGITKVGKHPVHVRANLHFESSG